MYFCFGCIGETVEYDGVFRHISDTFAIPLNDRDEQLQTIVLCSKSILYN